MAKTDKTAKTVAAPASCSSAPFGGGLYIVTIIGAAVYFVGQVDGFWNILFAFVKALVWPGFVVYKVLELLSL